MVEISKEAAQNLLCTETSFKAQWKNVAVDGSVCAKNEAGARAAITDIQVTRDVRTAAGNAAANQLSCSELPCQVGQCSQQGASVKNLVRRGAPYNLKNTGERGTCDEGETKWEYRIRVDAEIEVTCDCPQPA